MKVFVRAVLVGTLAGAWLPSIFTALLAVGTLPDGLNGDGRLWESLWLAISPITVTLPIVLGSCLLLGLPTAWLLKRLNRETKVNYIVVGAICGFMVPIAILRAPAGWLLAVLGSFSGGMAAASWSKSMQVE